MIYTYSPNEIKIEVAGYQLAGFTKVSISKTSDSFTIIKGIRGKNTRVANSDSSCTISISVLQTSFVNDVFSEIVRLDKKYGTGRLELYLRDNEGSTLIQSDLAYINDYPKADLTEELSERVWTITCLACSEFVIGGNGGPSKSIFDSVTSLF